MQLREMIASHPHVKGSTNDPLIAAIEEAYACAATCLVCADACLGEGMVADLTQCIRVDLDCADVCFATGKVASRRTGSNEALIVSQLRTCVESCRICAEECEKHAGMHDHCRLCAEACRRCERACREAIDTINA